MNTPVRCPWPVKPLDVEYHDLEWGVPVHDDRTLFEFITLEGAQAGLSWSTVLAKRPHYRDAFRQWDVQAIAAFTPAQVDGLMQNAGLVRHRQKLDSTIGNARAFLQVQEAFGTFDAYLWRFVNGAALDMRRTESRQIPTQTALSDAISKDLKARGFRFVGTTICYAYMQAVGLVNDHLVSCFRHGEIGVRA
ncbi:MAG: DNA-3-methyladenine glycosylase I [Gemmatimonadota bacterium]|nr:DNA-3-methyladenine glycosylase I [Gemmatimonadota bacterium]MDQ8168659.1 DNA-3-methyladenine glycosylase I [Gemmatimonadota bacterium]MDQ8173545.1 DNA-3-methyladenine glycosylase I [Gemmatimonadota bacterium]